MVHLSKAKPVMLFGCLCKLLYLGDLERKCDLGFRRDIMGRLGLYGTEKSELGFRENSHFLLISEIQLECGKMTRAWVQWDITSFSAFISAEISIL